jgi:DNA-binding transcriptional MerR regulator
VKQVLYTVKEISLLANVTIKTLHHYHKIGLLLPCKISEAGYRLYGIKELERLQQILFYRELDFPLEKIKQLLKNEPERLSILMNQKELLLARKKRLEHVIHTLEKSIDCTMKGEIMDKTEMFKGFKCEAEWQEALVEQNQYLQETYDYNLLDKNTIDVEKMNETAIEAKHFTDGMASALKAGLKFDHQIVRKLISKHIDFLNNHGHTISPKDFMEQARFFLDDDFHRNMLESQQIGLAYYLFTAAESFAANQ